MNYQNFPSPQIPPFALLGRIPSKKSTAHQIPYILDVKNFRLTTSGRASIALALEHAGIGENDEILIPSYHCEAMVAPARWRKAKIVFFRINRDTSIVLDDIKEKITPKTRAILVTHYFGFEQQLQELKKICTENNIILIEDCAHAMFGLSSGKAIGTTGDYAVGSSMKFLPIYEGGMICSATQTLDNIELSPPPLKFQIKSAINTIEFAIQYQRLGVVGSIFKSLFMFKDFTWNQLKSAKIGFDGNRLGPSSSEGEFGLDEAWIHKKSSWFSAWIIKNTNVQKVAQIRRHNYSYMLKRLAKLPNCEVIFDKLADHTVPWVFPVYVKEPEKYFAPLKLRGIPVWRFGEFLDPMVTKDICPVSVEYSKHIFQFPCHQSLKQSEIDWMLNSITDIFTEKQ